MGRKMAAMPEEILGLEELLPRERLQQFYEAIGQVPDAVYFPGIHRT